MPPSASFQLINEGVCTFKLDVVFKKECFTHHNIALLKSLQNHIYCFVQNIIKKQSVSHLQCSTSTKADSKHSFFSLWASPKFSLSIKRPPAHRFTLKPRRLQRVNWGSTLSHPALFKQSPTSPGVNHTRHLVTTPLTN